MPSDSAPRESFSQSRSRWPAVVLAVFVALFLLTIWQRNRIRAYWWAARLEKAEDLTARTYYLSCLVSVGDSAKGAICRLARSENSEVRALAIPAMARLSEPVRFAELDRLLADSDAEVRQSAALALAFAGSEAATNVLARRAMGRDSAEGTMTAAAALSRLSSPAALAVLCKVAREHPNAAVRAQAVESIGAWLVSETGRDSAATSRPASDGEPFGVLVALLADRGDFAGALSLEREIASAERAAKGPDGVPLPKGAHVAGPREPASLSASATGHRTVADVAAHWLSLLSLEAVEPRTRRSSSEQAELADRCRQAWAAGEPAAFPRRVDPARQGPRPPNRETPANSSSDTNPG